MAEPKTNQAAVNELLEGVVDEEKRKDSLYLLELMTEISGCEPVLWNHGIIGFGNWHYKYESGPEGDWFVIGLSPRKQNLSIYLMDGFSRYEELMGQLGKHKTGKSCLYIKRLSDIDPKALRKLIEESYAHFEKKKGPQN